MNPSTLKAKIVRAFHPFMPVPPAVENDWTDFEILSKEIKHNSALQGAFAEKMANKYLSERDEEPSLVFIKLWEQADGEMEVAILIRPAEKPDRTLEPIL